MDFSSSGQMRVHKTNGTDDPLQDPGDMKPQTADPLSETAKTITEIVLDAEKRVNANQNKSKPVTAQ